jgi:hypothetical protein
MADKRFLKFIWWGLLLFGLLCIYVFAYLLTTEVYHGRLGDTRYRIRLFQSVWHERIFSPLLATEQRLRPAMPEFSGQVHSGADLPPADNER